MTTLPIKATKPYIATFRLISTSIPHSPLLIKWGNTRCQPTLTNNLPSSTKFIRWPVISKFTSKTCAKKDISTIRRLESTFLTAWLTQLAVRITKTRKTLMLRPIRNVKKVSNRKPKASFFSPYDKTQMKLRIGKDLSKCISAKIRLTFIIL